MTKKKEPKERPERKPNWKEYTTTVEDIQNFIMDRMMLRHNVITRRVEYRIPSDFGREGTDWMPISDRVVNTLWSELSADKVVRAPDIYRVLESDFVPEFNPFQFYLDQLPKWDGGDHILAMSVSVSVKGEVEEQLRFAQYLKKWLVGMVAGWIDPAVVNNVILVLIGEQGSYKTTWFNYILPPPLRPYFYTKTNAGKMGRDDLFDAGAIWFGVLRGVGHHAPLGTEPAESGGDDAVDRRASFPLCILKNLRYSFCRFTLFAYLCTRNFKTHSVMIDLKNPKWEDFHIIDIPPHELKPRQEVHCGLYRIKPGSPKPDNSQMRITQMPKEWYDEFFQKRV